MIFRVALDHNGKSSGWLYAANDELLAWAGRHYVSLEFAGNQASAFQSAAPGAMYETYPRPDGCWGWRAVQPIEYCMAYSARGYTKPAEARHAARTIRKAAPHASGL